jgi:hypothetical protein
VQRSSASGACAKVASDPEKIKATAATATLASISLIFWFAFLQQRKCKTPRGARGVLLNQPTRGGIDGLVLFFSTSERSDGSLGQASLGSTSGKQSFRARQTIGWAKIDVQLPSTPIYRPGTSAKSERNLQRIPAPAGAFSKLRVVLRGPRFSDQSPHGDRGAIASVLFLHMSCARITCWSSSIG